MNYTELKQIFRALKCDSPKDDLTAHIIFTEDSFDEKYSLLSRTYCFSSDNKAFWPHMGGYSIFACCLDGTDQGVRLDRYMAEEGNSGGWKVEDCYILERMRDAAAIPHFYRTEQSDGTVCYFFGDTCIQARETKENGKICLEPLAGNQVVCGEWIDLSIDRVYGYCTLLVMQLSGKNYRCNAAFIASANGGRNMKVKAYIHSLKDHEHDRHVLGEAEIIRQIGDNLYLAEVNGVRCTAIFNPFSGRYFVDDVYGLHLEVPHA